MDEHDIFAEILLAAMKDAAIEMKLTQLKTQIDADGKGLKHVRIIIVPEAMEYQHPDGRPFGQKEGNN